MKRVIAMMFGQKVTFLNVNTRKYIVQYWYKGKMH